MTYPPSPTQRDSLDWLVSKFAREVSGVTHAVLVSADGLLMAASEHMPIERADQLAAVASGLASLSTGASQLFNGGYVLQSVVEMENGYLLLMRVGDGSNLAVLTQESADLNELVALASDDGELDEVAESVATLKRELDRLQEEALFSGEYDPGDAVVSIHAGEGGTDAQDWAEMLLRMYLRWAEGRGFKTELLEASPGEEAGLKSATFTVAGENAYGVPISVALEESSGREVLLGSVYAALARLEAKGLVASSLGEPTAERGGRAKRFFRVTAKGLREARTARRTLVKLWTGLPAIESGRS